MLITHEKMGNSNFFDELACAFHGATFCDNDILSFSCILTDPCMLAHLAK